MFTIEHLLSNGIPAVCPASGARASDGKTCPVGGHLPTNNDEKTFKPAPWRMELSWYENEPVYARPFKRGSVGWAGEEVKIALGLLKREDRRGAQRWMPATLRVQEKGLQGLGGFRLKRWGRRGWKRRGGRRCWERPRGCTGERLEGDGHSSRERPLLE